MTDKMAFICVFPNLVSQAVVVTDAPRSSSTNSTPQSSPLRKHLL